MPGYDYNSKNMNAKQGFTIIELLVAMLISSFIMVGMVQMFRSQRIAFSLMEKLQVLEENGRVGIDFIATDIASAYYPSSDGTTPSAPVSLYDNLVAPTDFDDIRLNLDVLVGTDVLEVFTTSCPGDILLAGLNKNAAISAKFPASYLVGCMDCFYSGMPQGEMDDCTSQYTLLISSKDLPGETCVQTLTNGHYTGGTLKLEYNRANGEQDGAARNTPQECGNLFTGAFGDAYAVIGEDVFYYIRADDPDNTSGTPNPQLMRYVFGGSKEVIANYAEDFQILVGEDGDADGDIDTWASGISNGTNVRVLKLSLMLKTQKTDRSKTAESPREFADLGSLENSTITNIDIQDRNRRRMLSRTVRMRNMEQWSD